ncbi:family 64 glycoside hydrolase [Cryphonectria parasitica EP155]|uniref:Family 64 glycoside hydrolase n=1 Tax=Cryphonectria parasitica (strain ATCC 38755 / EP155) TaxID=660469 RepID=A0A9P5CN21_CRYP1|nr:family 64 glycoside hydrolase [Cryphonectria parasitica EP155]KAF3764718.1 family 64 glycoside hydrolase [Cryphonectria parasitica EP155]
MLLSTVRLLTPLVGVLLSFSFPLAQCLPVGGNLVSSPGKLQPAAVVSVITRPTDTVNILHHRAETAITIHNTVASGKNLYIYITGDVDTSGSQSMLQTNGQWLTLNAGGSVTPVNVTRDVGFLAKHGQSTTLTLPSYISSARMYAFEGAQMEWQMVGAASGITTVVQPVVTDPGTLAYDTRWGFIELTSGDEEFFVNLSFVDFVALAFGIAVTDESGANHTIPGLMNTLPGSANTTAAAAATTPAEKICAGLQQQAEKDGNKWGELCIYGDDNNSTLLRVLSPQDGAEQHIAFASDDYYEPYITKVWQRYAKQPLYIDTQQAGLGTINDTIVSCTVDAATDDALVCTGTAVRMPRPTTADIWGCNSGAFAINATADNAFKAIVPRVCAAFTRSTLLVEGGHVQPGPPAAMFYREADITNHYARVVHAHETVGGYAFAYDDVAVGSQDPEGAVQVSSAKTLEVYIGG